MTRTRVVAYTALTAVEVTWNLHANLPSLYPALPCPPRSECVVALSSPFPWLWLAMAALLVASAIAIVLRKEAGVATGFLAQLLTLAPFVRDIANRVGSFLFTGLGYSGVDPDFRD